MKYYQLKNYFCQFVGPVSDKQDKDIGYIYCYKNKELIKFKFSLNRGIFGPLDKIYYSIERPSRRDRYMEAYKILEGIGNIKPELRFRALRVSFSHSKNKITEKSIVNYLLQNFGSTEITFNKKNHVSLFYQIFTELLWEIQFAVIMQLKVDGRKAVAKKDQYHFEPQEEEMIYKAHGQKYGTPYNDYSFMRNKMNLRKVPNE